MHTISTAESRYNHWVQEHYRFLMRSAWALTGSRALAEDVVQDCFTSAWKHRKQLRDPAMARAWLFQIMRRHAFRHMAPQPVLAVALDEDGAWAGGMASHSPADGLDDQLDVAPGTVLSCLSRAREALKAVLSPAAVPETAAAAAMGRPRLRKV